MSGRFRLYHVTQIQLNCLETQPGELKKCIVIVLYERLLEVLRFDIGLKMSMNFFPFLLFE